MKTNEIRLEDQLQTHMRLECEHCGWCLTCEHDTSKWCLNDLRPIHTPATCGEGNKPFNSGRK